MSKIFICYSHQDELIKDELQKYLSVYSHDIEPWSDRNIQAGEDWKNKILESLNSCDAAIMLISTDFLVSKFIREIEIPTLLKRREEEGVIVFPFIIKNCAWMDVSNISEIQARPEDGEPLNTFMEHKKEEILTKFSREIKTILSANKISSSDNSIVSVTKTNEFDINKNENLLTQLYCYFNQIFKELKVLPEDLIFNEYPFKNGLNNFTYRRIFSLMVNKELGELFKTFLFKNKELVDNFETVDDFKKANYLLT